MSEVGSALRLFALANSSIEAALGDRFRPVTGAQSDERPFATYQVISSSPDEALDGDCAHQHDRIQVDVWADDDAVCYSIARALRTRLLTAAGTVNVHAPTTEIPTPPRIVIDGVETAGGIRDAGAQSPIDGGDDWLYRCSFDLHVSFTPSTP